MQIEFNITVLLFFLASYMFFRGLCLFIQNKNIIFKNEVTNFGLYISIVFIISATLFPIKTDVLFEGFNIYNLIPFKVPIMIYQNSSLMYFLYQVIGNILLFVPFGFFVYSKSGFNVRVSILSVLFMTLFIEIVQGFIPYRFCEIDDILLNSFGGVIGIFSYFMLVKVLPKKEISKS